MRAWLILVPLAPFAGCSSGPPPSTTAPPPAAAPAETKAASQPTVPPPAPAPAVPEEGGPAKAWTGPLPPMPFADYPAGRPPETIKAVYEYAARHPEVLHYVPCFCGCERGGHRNNDDCFVSGREANGRPIWEPHGAT
jgi:Protein of unknown function with PCYCGC motif